MIFIGRKRTVQTWYIRSAISLLLVAAFFLVVPITYADDCFPVNDPPTLYQIDRSPTQATLYFTPINDQIQSYTITYGLSAEDERYSTTFDHGVSTGAIAYTLNDLQSGVQYFYKVRGNTSCSSSPWSTWVGDKAVTSGTEKIIPLSAIPVTGPEEVLPAVFSIGLFVLGFTIFALGI